MIWIALLIALVWAVSVWRLQAVREVHHFYYGAALFVVGYLVGWRWLSIVGLIVMADDAIQHAVQLERPAFRSPLHLAYRYLLYPLVHR